MSNKIRNGYVNLYHIDIDSWLAILVLVGLGIENIIPLWKP